MYDSTFFFLKKWTDFSKMLNSEQASVRPLAIFKMLISYCSKRTVSITVVYHHMYRMMAALLGAPECCWDCRALCLQFIVEITSFRGSFLRAARMKSIWGGSRRWLVYAARTESFSLLMASSSGLQQEHVLSIFDFICSVLRVSHNHKYLS